MTAPGRVRAVVLGGLMLAQLGGGRPAAADKAEAERWHASGTRLFDQGRYREAIALFERALAEHEHANTLYALGESWRRLGALRRSYGYYARYAALLPPAERAAFASKLARLRTGQRFRCTVYTEPPGGEVWIDGARVGTTVNGPVVAELPGGARRVIAQLADGRRTERRVVGEFGEPQVLRLHLPAADKLEFEDPWGRRSARSRARGAHAGSRPAPRADRGVEVAAGLSIGPSVTSFGDADLQVSASFVLALHGDLVWRFGRFGLRAGALVSVAPLTDEIIADRAAVVTALLEGGLRYWPWSRWWIEASFAAGAGLVVDVAERSFLLDGTGAAERTLAGLALRPALGLGWEVSSWLSLALHPLVVTYLPRTGGLADLAHGMRLLRVELLLSVSLSAGR